MKKLLFTFILSLFAVPACSQVLLGLYTGAGGATHNNYDLGLTSGGYFYKGVAWRMAVGAHLFSQQYNIYYDNEMGQPIGRSIRNKSNYVFIAPSIDYHLRKHGYTHVYLNAGVGFNIGAEDTLRKWAYIPVGNYDSSIGKADNINKMVVRVGMGLIHHFPFRGKRIFLTLSEDVGFLANKISKTTDVADVRLNNNVNQIYRPLVISVRLGVCFRSKKS